jgi:tripartite-type tricarboxylate transporter receptor subunit TctC
MRRRTALTGMMTLAMARVARAQEVYPSRPVRLVVPFAPGASSDTLARLITAKATGPLGGTFVIENRAGAGGLIAAQYVARAAPDGYTLLWGGGTAITHAVMQANPGYDVLRDFTPVIALSAHPAVLAVRHASPYQDMAGLLAAAKSVPGGLRYGSGGIGTPAHMAAAAMLKLAGTEGTHVPYRGANQATLAVEQGEVDFAFAISNIALPRQQQGVVRILCTAGAARMAALPTVPTLAETLPRGPVVVSTSSVVGPAGLPEAATRHLYGAFHAAVANDAALRAGLIAEGGEIVLSDSPAAYAAAWADELQRLRDLVALSGARIE